MTKNSKPGKHHKVNITITSMASNSTSYFQGTSSTFQHTHLKSYSCLLENVMDDYTLNQTF